MLNCYLQKESVTQGELFPKAKVFEILMSRLGETYYSFVEKTETVQTEQRYSFPRSLLCRLFTLTEPGLLMQP